MVDITGSRAIERTFALAQMGQGPGLVLDIGPGPKPKLCVESLRRGFDVIAVDREEISKDWVMYSLKGDRKFEWGWVNTQLPRGAGSVLDIGPAPANPKPSRIAVDRGWTVTAVGLEEPYKSVPQQRFTFIQGDFNDVSVGGPFDWILNISTIEHFGLAGRYGVTERDDDADLRGMAKALMLLKQDGRMILTIPVGQDAVFVPRHRVYGPERLPLLLDGYRIHLQKFYAKFDRSDDYVECDRQTALDVQPTIAPNAYYGLGLFVLGAA